MSESYMDILSGNGNLDACRVVLLDAGRHGAAPVIERTTCRTLFHQIANRSGLACGNDRSHPSQPDRERQSTEREPGLPVDGAIAAARIRRS